MSVNHGVNFKANIQVQKGFATLVHVPIIDLNFHTITQGVQACGLNLIYTDTYIYARHLFSTSESYNF